MKLKPSDRFSFLLGTAIAALLSAPLAFATTLTWDNGAATGNWNTVDLNWTGSAWSNATPDDAIFGATGVGTVTLTEAITAGSIAINTTGYTITGETITLNSGATALTSSATSVVNSNVTMATAAGIITSSVDTLTLGGTLNAGSLGLTFAGAGNTTVSSAITNGTTLTKSGAGVLTLAGSNGFTSTTISGGSISGGTLSLSAGVTALTSTATSAVNSNVTLTTAAGTVTSSTGTLTLGGTLDAGSLGLTIAGSGNTTVSNGIANATTLTKSGGGTLILGGTNNHAGATSIGAGILQAGSATGLSPNSDISLASGTRLILGGFSSTVGALIGTGGVVENANSTPVTLTVGNTNASGAYSSNLQDGTGGGALAVIKTGSGAQAITSGDFTGGLTISNGTWQLGGVNGLGNGPVIMAAGAKLSSNGTNARVLVRTTNTIAVNGSITLGDVTNTGQLTLPGAVTLASTPTITVAGGTQVFSGVVGGTTFIKAGPGRLNLTNAANTYPSGTTISAGTLGVTADGCLGVAGTDITFTGIGAIAPGGAISYARNIIINSSLASFDNAGSTIFTGNVTGVGGIATVSGFGCQVVLNGTANAFEGPITIGSTGTTTQAYRIAFASLLDSPAASKITFSASSVTHANGSVFEYTGTTALALTNRQFEIASNGAAPLNGHQIRGNGTGSGSLTINANLSVTSTTAQTLALRGTNTASSFVGLIGNGSSAAITLTKLDAGTWALSNANTYTGPTRITGGTLIVNSLAIGGASSGIGQSTSVPINLLLGGGTLQYAPISAVGGAAATTDRNFTLVASSAIDSSGTGALVFSTPTGSIISPDVTGLTFNAAGGNKILTNLSSTANLAVGMRITGTGIPANATIASIDSATQITLTASTNVTAGTGVAASMGYTARTLTLTGANTDANTIGGNLVNSTATGTQALSVTKAGLGSWVLAGANSYTGATTISGGRLIIDDGSIATSGSIVNNAALEFKLNTNAGSYANVISGTGSLTKTGTNTLTLSGLNTYSGNTAVSAGTLELADNARLRFVLGATTGVTNTITGAGTATLNGDFVIDTAAADALASGTWTIENVDTLTGAYGSTFSVVGFVDAGGDKWTKVNGAKTYTFDETTGILTLAPAGGYAGWKSTNTTSQTINLDHDSDGVSNGIEYFLGGTTNTTGFTPVPGVINTLGTLSITWIKSGTYPVTATYGTDFVVETSSTLTGPWGTASLGAGPNEVVISGNNVTYTFPSSGSVNFARLKVTGP